MVLLRFSTFGRLRIVSSEKTVSSFPTRHAEELLLYLLIHSSISHSRETLIDLLWPNTSLKKGRARLSTTLWQLGKLFSGLACSLEDFIQTTRTTIQFEPVVAFESDFQNFATLLNQARNARAEPENYQGLLKSACEQYTGELGSGIYSEWCLIWREKYARKFLRAQAELMAVHMQQMQWEEAIRVGQQILDENPLREDIHRSLMFCLAETGKHSQAIAQYQTLSTLLSQELSIWPMHDTMQLYMQILNGRFQKKSPLIDKQAALEEAYQAFHQASLHLNTLLNQLPSN